VKTRGRGKKESGPRGKSVGFWEIDSKETSCLRRSFYKEALSGNKI